MKIKEEISKLKNIDIYSFMLFALFKIRDIPEYSAISELAYILDKESLLRLCEYFGGITITIPTIEELQSIIYGLILYQYVDVDKLPYAEANKLIGCNAEEMKQVRHIYAQIKELLANYDLSVREKP